MKYVPSCAECQRLWQAYSAATTEHFESVNLLEIAKLRHDQQEVLELGPMVEAAARRRVETRAAFRTHEASAHLAADAAKA